jgi:hypothetical protein
MNEQDGKRSERDGKWFDRDTAGGNLLRSKGYRWAGRAGSLSVALYVNSYSSFMRVFLRAWIVCLGERATPGGVGRSMRQLPDHLYPEAA